MFIDQKNICRNQPLDQLEEFVSIFEADATHSWACEASDPPQSSYICSALRR